MGPGDYWASVSAFAGTYAPVNWATCSGQQMPVNQNQALYALIGNAYSPNGQFSPSVFNLPNLIDGVPLGVGQAADGMVVEEGEFLDEIYGQWSGGVPGGTQSQVVSPQGIPVVNASGAATGDKIASGTVPAYGAANPTTLMGSANGTGMQWCICISGGIWPPRPN